MIEYKNNNKRNELMNEREKSRLIMKKSVVYIMNKDYHSLNKMLINANLVDLSLREAVSLLRSTYALKDLLTAWQPKLEEVYIHYQNDPKIEAMLVGLLSLIPEHNNNKAS